jgi:hypothetical protein
MDKIHYQTDQEDLLRLCDGQMFTLYDGSIKSAASDTFTKEMLREYAPDKDHFMLHVVAMGDQETYGCVAGDTKIALHTGAHKDIKDIQVGDAVLTGEGNIKNVNHLFQYDLDEAIKVSVGGIIDDLIVSPNHPFRVAKFEQFTCSKDKYKRCLPPTFGEQNICNRPLAQKSCAIADYRPLSNSYIDADQLRARDFLLFKLPQVPAEEDISVHEATVIGYWLAEGSFTKNAGNREPNGLSFAFDKNGEDVYMDNLKQCAEAIGFKYSRYDYPTATNSTVNLTRRPERARQYQLWFGDGSHNKRIPAWLFSISREAKLALIKAYYEGDGCVSFDNVAAATTVSYNLAVGMQRLLWSVGVPATAFKYHSSAQLPGAETAGKVEFNGYRVNYSYTNVPEQLRHGNIVDLKQTTKVHLFVYEGVVYLPIRSIESIPWDEKIYTLEVDGDHSYISNGVWSKNSNKNGDGFPKEALEKYHPTFISDGCFFREHRNRCQQTQGIGSIKASAFNSKMRRVELIVHGNKEKAAKEYEMAKSGKALSFSMSCRVPYDICNCCEKKASSPVNYCDHLKHNMLQYIPEFKKYAFAINDKPKFFDISAVDKPADRIAHYLDYAFPAGEKSASFNGVITGTQWASFEGVRLPGNEPTWDPKQLALLEKLAAAEEYVSHILTTKSAAKDHKAAFVRDVVTTAFGDELEDKDIEKLRTLQVGTMCRELAKRASILPFYSFIAYATGRTLQETKDDPITKRACAMLPDIFKKLMSSSCGCELGNMFDSSSEHSCGADAANDDEVQKLMDMAEQKFSIKTEPVKNRVMTIMIIKGASEKVADKSSIQLTESFENRALALAETYGLYKLSAVQDIVEFHGAEIDEPQYLLTVGQNLLK